MIAYKRAFDRTSQGKTTGPASRLLSWLVLNLYVIIAALLVRNGLYLPLLLVVVLAFTPIAPLGIVALTVYFVYIKLWPGLLLILLSCIAAFASVRLGVRYNERRIKARGALIDPFEVMPEVGLATIVQLAAFALALILHGFMAIIFFIVSIISALFLVSRFAFRLRSRWCRIHYPLMLRYSALAGEEAARATAQARAYSMANVLRPFLRGVYPDRSDDELQAIYTSAESKLAQFSDETPLRQFFATSPERSAQFERAATAIKSDILTRRDWDAKLLRYIIAEIVTREFGHAERLKYLVASLTGDAS